MPSRVNVTAPFKMHTIRSGIGACAGQTWGIFITQKPGYFGTIVQAGTINATVNRPSGLYPMGGTFTPRRTMRWHRCFTIPTSPGFWVRSFDRFGQNPITEAGTPPPIPTPPTVAPPPPSGRGAIPGGIPQRQTVQSVNGRLQVVPRSQPRMIRGVLNGYI